MSTEKVNLALGGGTAYGFTHIGVLRRLEDENLRPAVIAGTSMGALIAALYSRTGSAEEVAGLCRRFFVEKTWKRLFPLNLPFARSIVRTDIIRSSLAGIFGMSDIADLPIPLIITGSDLKSGRTILFKQGPLVDLLMASMAVPFFFPPLRLLGYHLVDGGMTSLVPVRACSGYPGRTIACHAYGKYKPFCGTPGILRVHFHSQYMLDHALGRMEIESTDCTAVYPDTSGIGMFQFHRLDELMERGYEAAKQALQPPPR
ncbi:MAG: patatin-like phospholipase family protein [Candidatus Wallbacteria bacterium]|nr:patatin-like phospholipase family protein [Candidatus Wallbacteria bacterium]